MKQGKRFQEKVTALLQASYAVDINPLPALRKRFGGKWEWLNPNGFSDASDEAGWYIVFKPDNRHWVGYTK